MLGETEGVVEHLVRLQAKPEIGPGKVADVVTETFRLSDGRKVAVELTTNGLAEATSNMLMTAQKDCKLWGSERIDTPHLLLALLDEVPPRLASILEQSPLYLNLKRMREHLQQHLREMRSQVKREVAFRLPPGFLPSEDLTYRVRTEGMTPALHLDSYFDTLTRALYCRRNNHVLVTGLRGVGKTTLLWELARRAASGEIPFLKRKRFLLVDCRDVPPQGSKSRLEEILSHVSGRTDLIVCLDEMGPLLRAESGGNNKLILRGALKENRIHLIGVISNWDFEDLISSDYEFLEFLTRLEVEEPGREASIDIVEQACKGLERDYKMRVDERAIERAVVLSADYILNERLPMKAIKVLQRVCENLHYERTQLQGDRDTATPADVIKIIAQITGVPEGTLSGISEKTDYERDLSLVVVGQEEAVRSVAMQLRLIKGGSTEPNKPASVMLFAGLTGVGKTELAKALARFYSSSKRLQTYTMGNFTQAHTISGIIGVPPGYVGHEQGGRIVNDLNSDPYCVFLLDEAEKAHPDIWKPFLNLFDEGWIVDTRGVKAFADRAIFILTSNAGHDIISRMSQAREPMERIIEAVKTALSEIRHEHSREPVFSPEFLARITRIIIFKPLDEAGMEGICRKMLEHTQKVWKEKRDKTIVVPEAFIHYIARQSHLENERSGGKEGGRIVRKLLQELVEATIQKEISERSQEYRHCDVIELTLVDPGATLPYQRTAVPKIFVDFHASRAATPAECMEQAIEELTSIIENDSKLKAIVTQKVSECMSRFHSRLNQYQKDNPAAVDPSALQGLLDRFQQTCTEMDLLATHTGEQVRSMLGDLITRVRGIREGESA